MNDPGAFAQRFGMSNPKVIVYLRFLVEQDRELIRTRKEAMRRQRELLRRYRSGEDIEELDDLVSSAREEVRLLRGFLNLKTTLRAFAKGVERFPKDMRLRDLRRLEQRVNPMLHRVLPQEAMNSLRGRMLICPSCDRVFLRDFKKRAQKFCTQCRSRFSKGKLWYRTRGKDWFKKRRAENHKGGGKR
jgi:hypothetical protein